MSSSFPEALATATERIRGLIDRVHDRDHTVWRQDPTEVADRLGWLDAPAAFTGRAEEFDELAATVRADGIDRVVLLGMGGSSLYPQVLDRVFGTQDGGAELTVLDTTNPTAVARALAAFQPGRSLVVPASKSGGTIETRTLLDAFWHALVEALGPGEAGRHAVAITDPGSDLAALGRDHGYRAVVENPADIGGRFAALSAFGMVPAALLGLDVEAHLAPGVAMIDQSRQPYEQNGPAQLGAFLAAAMLTGRFALTIHLPAELAPLGDWIEQLVAESTGKHGTGLLPIVTEPLLDDDAYGDTRALVIQLTGDTVGHDTVAPSTAPFLHLPIATADDMSAEVVRWEFATALAGAVVDINPFDQPNVQAAKSAAQEVIDADGDPVIQLGDASGTLDAVGADDAIVILGYLDPEGDDAAALPTIATALQGRHGVPVTVGIGPRYLHSTGQLHKGGPGAMVFLVVVDLDDDTDVAIPGRDLGFRKLFRGQAAGDLAALREADRRVAAVTMDDLRNAVAG